MLPANSDNEEASCIRKSAIRLGEQIPINLNDNPNNADKINGVAINFEPKKDLIRQDQSPGSEDAEKDQEPDREEDSEEYSDVIIPPFWQSWKRTGVALDTLKRYAYTGTGLTQEQIDYLRDDRVGRYSLAIMRDGLWHPADKRMLDYYVWSHDKTLVQRVVERVSADLLISFKSQDRQIFPSDIRDTVTMKLVTILAYLEASQRKALGSEKFCEDEEDAHQHIEQDKCAICIAKSARALTSWLYREVMCHYCFDLRQQPENLEENDIPCSDVSAVIALTQADDQAQIELNFHSETTGISGFESISDMAIGDMHNATTRGTVNILLRGESEVVTLRVESKRQEYRGSLLRLSLLSPTGEERFYHYLPMLPLDPPAKGYVAFGCMCLGELQTFKTTAGTEWAVLLQQTSVEAVPPAEQQRLELAQQWTMEHLAPQYLKSNTGGLVTSEQTMDRR